jgi:hypothetical protein
VHTLQLLEYNTREGRSSADALVGFADIYDYALLDGRRITFTTSSRRNSAGSSTIQAYFGGEAYAGEVRAILLHRQPSVSNPENTVLVMVEWMKESDDSPLDGDDEGLCGNSCASFSLVNLILISKTSFSPALSSVLSVGSMKSTKIRRTRVLSRSLYHCKNFTANSPAAL